RRVEEGRRWVSRNQTESTAGKRRQVSKYWQTANDLRDQSKGLQVHWCNILKQVGRINGFPVFNSSITHYSGVESLGYLSFDTVEGSSANKEDIFGIDSHHRSEEHTS